MNRPAAIIGLTALMFGVRAACGFWPFSSAPARSNTEQCRWVADYESRRWDRDYIIHPKHATYEREPSSVVLNLEEKHSCGGRGQSLEIRWNRDRSGWCGYYLELKDRFGDPVDISAFTELVFMVRGKQGGEIFQLSCADRAMMEREADGQPMGYVDEFLPGGLTTEWREVRVPLAFMDPRVDARRMGMFSWNFTEAGEGMIYLDDVRLEARTRAAERPFEEESLHTEPWNNPVPPPVATPVPVRDAAASGAEWNRGAPVEELVAPSGTTEEDVANLRRMHAPATEPMLSSETALWVWKIDPVRNETECRELLDFCGRTGVRLLYLYRPAFRHRKEAYRDDMGAFLKKCHDAGLRVFGLNGDASWWQASRHGTPLSMLEDYLAFNRSRTPEERFDGLQLDIEPYVTTAWQKDREKVKREFLALLSALRALRDADGSSFQLDYAVPVMYAGEDDGVFLRRILEQVDSLALMDYYDQTARILRAAEPFLQAGEAAGKKIWIGLETQDLVRMGQGQFSNTYYDEGWSGLERDLRFMEEQLAGSPAFGGMAVHTYYSYRRLPQIGKKPERKRPAPDAVQSLPLHAAKAPGPVVVDGVLAEWSRAEAVRLDDRVRVVHGPQAWSGPDDLSANVWALYDREHLYMAFEVTDDVLLQAWQGEEMWRGDHVELWLDVRLQHDYCIAVADADDIQFGFSPGDFEGLRAECAIFTGNRNGVEKIDVAAKNTPTGYVLEVSIPWEVLFEGLGVSAVEEGMLGISVDPSDCDALQVDQETLMSTSVARRWGDPTTFGILYLENDESAVSFGEEAKP